MAEAIGTVRRLRHQDKGLILICRPDQEQAILEGLAQMQASGALHRRVIVRASTHLPPGDDIFVADAATLDQELPPTPP